MLGKSLAALACPDSQIKRYGIRQTGEEAVLQYRSRG
jgi:hypothetical protein